MKVTEAEVAEWIGEAPFHIRAGQAVYNRLATRFGGIRLALGVADPWPELFHRATTLPEVLDELRRKGLLDETPKAWQQYTPRTMHRLLIDRCLSDRYRNAGPDEWPQALHCPYYVPLEGNLGGDWGVIVNPHSSRFGLLTFEHDDCGCPDPPDDDPAWDRYGEGARHGSAPNQDGDMWSTSWEHRHDEMCEEPCPWADIEKR
jgi:hypothetical protein